MRQSIVQDNNNDSGARRYIEFTTKYCWIVAVTSHSVKLLPVLEPRYFLLCSFTPRPAIRPALRNGDHETEFQPAPWSLFTCTRIVLVFSSAVLWWSQSWRFVSLDGILPIQALNQSQSMFFSHIFFAG